MMASQKRRRCLNNHIFGQIWMLILRNISRAAKDVKREKITYHLTLLSPLPQCTAPNQRVHIDIFGPLKTSVKGKKMLLSMMDAFTKYVELVALADKEAETTGDAIFHKWICRYGTPLEII